MNLPTYPKYRRSGISWLADIPAHWDVATVRRLCTIKKRIAGALGYDVLSITQGGIKVKDTDSNDGQLSMDYSKYQLVDVGDFAMNHMDLLTGWVDISPFEGVTSPDYRVFATACQQLSAPRYLLYLFQMGYENKILFAFGQGSSQLGRWRLPRQAFNDFQLPVPEIGEQRRIVAFLDKETIKIDALIAEQRRLIELLKEKREAVISRAVTKGINPAAPMKPSGVEWMGDIPTHWRMTTLARITEGRCDGPFGSGLKSEHYTDTGVRVVRLQNIRADSFASEDAAYIDSAYYETQLQGHDVRRGDVLIAGLGDDKNLVGRACVAPDGIEPAMVKADCFRFRVDKENACSRFVAIQLSAGAAAAAGLLATGSTRSRISLSTMATRRLALPPIGEQENIIACLSEQINAFHKLIGETEDAIALLQERRTALISAAVTGKIDVRSLILSKVA